MASAAPLLSGARAESLRTSDSLPRGWKLSVSETTALPSDPAQLASLLSSGRPVNRPRVSIEFPIRDVTAISIGTLNIATNIDGDLFDTLEKLTAEIKAVQKLFRQIDNSDAKKLHKAIATKEVTLGRVTAVYEGRRHTVLAYFIAKSGEFFDRTEGVPFVIFDEGKQLARVATGELVTNAIHGFHVPADRRIFLLGYQLIPETKRDFTFVFWGPCACLCGWRYVNDRPMSKKGISRAVRVNKIASALEKEVRRLQLTASKPKGAGALAADKEE